MADLDTSASAPAATPGPAAPVPRSPLATDLDDDLVPDGAALRTAVAAVAADIIRDDHDGPRSYLLHCERSVGQYLFDALLRAGAEYGLAVDGFRPAAG